MQYIENKSMKVIYRYNYRCFILMAVQSKLNITGIRYHWNQATATTSNTVI